MPPTTIAQSLTTIPSTSIPEAEAQTPAPEVIADPPIVATPEDVARQFVERSHAGEVEIALALLADDAHVLSAGLLEAYYFYVAVDGVSLPGYDHLLFRDSGVAEAQEALPLLTAVLLFESIFDPTVESITCGADRVALGADELGSNEVGCTVTGINALAENLGLAAGFPLEMHVDVEDLRITYLSTAVPDDRGLSALGLGGTLWAAYPDSYAAACLVTAEGPYFDPRPAFNPPPTWDPVEHAAECGQFVMGNYRDVTAIGSGAGLRSVDPAAKAAAESTARQFATTARAGNVEAAMAMLADDTVVSGLIHASWEAYAAGVEVPPDLLGLSDPPRDLYVATSPGDPVLALLAGSLTFEAAIETTVDAVRCGEDAPSFPPPRFEPPTEGGTTVRCAIIGTDYFAVLDPWTDFYPLVVHVDTTNERVSFVSPRIPSFLQDLAPRYDDDLYSRHPEEFQSACSVRLDETADQETAFGTPERFDLTLNPTPSWDPVTHATICGHFLIERIPELFD